LVNVNENSSVATDVDATDPNSGDILTYSISGGVDQNEFSIDSSTGVLTFNTTPDYENPTDSDNNNSYIVEVTVSDDASPSLSDTQTITVNVQDVVNEYLINIAKTQDGAEPNTNAIFNN